MKTIVINGMAKQILDENEVKALTSMTIIDIRNEILKDKFIGWDKELIDLYLFNKKKV